MPSPSFVGLNLVNKINIHSHGVKSNEYMIQANNSVAFSKAKKIQQQIEEHTS
jgi:hypothetical protein